MNLFKHRLITSCCGRVFLTALLAGYLSVSACCAAEAAKTADCLSCHKALGAQKFTHGPVGAGACTVCHVNEKPAAAQGKGHTFDLIKTGPEMCFSCHDAMREKFSSVKVKHGAIEGGGCVSCHDPHGSGQKFMLKGKTMSETCSACHENVAGGAVAHKPAKESCALCHEPHGGANAKLLTQAQPKLCLDCHQEMRTALNKKHLHKPVEAGCVGCHSPHSSAKASLLKADPKKELCLGCHDSIAKHLKNVKRPHAALETGGCSACHTPHASDQNSLLKKPMKELCSSCHKEMKAELQSQFPHGPVKLSQCQGCHDPHGATNPNILKTFFPPGFYNPYKDGLYALCFNCHKKDIALEAKTATLTDFRNGKENLHYTHVHSEKGRSCKACHQVHSSAQEKHVRAGVPFGSWMLPITFKKTANGGSCNVGCHNPKAYDRLVPVKNP